MNFFITYSRSDKSQVLSLVKDIEDLGHDVWYDQDLSGGQSWWDNVLSKIRDCDVYVFAISNESLDSTACKRELRYAEDLKKNPLPVLLKAGVSMALAQRYIAQLQYVDYSNPGEKTVVIKLINAINHLPKALPLPEPLPEPPSIPMSYLDTLKDKIEAPNLERAEQIELLSDLKLRINDPDNKKEDIIHLLRKLRKHDDLLASTGTEIDELLEKLTKQTPAKPTTTAEKKPVSTAAIPAVAPSTVAHDNGWSSGTMTVLVIASILIGLVGLIAGFIGISEGGAKKRQGTTLLVLGILSCILGYILYQQTMQKEPQFDVFFE